MGGGYYDREMETTTAETTYSDAAATAMASVGVNAACLPNRPIHCVAKTPIVLAMDVTRSRGNDSKILYDKLPMLFGQIMMQNYVVDPAVSFAAIGDVPCKDQGPLQVTDFAAGNDLDAWIQKLWLEEGGGGTGEESYEVAAYYYAKKCQLDCNSSGQKGFLFFTGDEKFYDLCQKDEIKQLIGDDLPESISSPHVFKLLQKKFHVFFLFPQKAMDARKADIDAEIAERLRREGAKSGDVTVSLMWDGYKDLDLHVVCPSKEEICFNHKKSKCGGELDVDMNYNGRWSDKPVENIYWPAGKAPIGKYVVKVNSYGIHDGAPTNEKASKNSPASFKVQIKINDEVEMLSFQNVNLANLVVVKEFQYNGPKAKKEQEDSYAAYGEESILKKWGEALPQGRVLVLKDPKAVVDVLLGVLSIFSGSRNLETYVGDMVTRGQSDTRIEEVTGILKGALLKNFEPEDDL